MRRPGCGRSWLRSCRSFPPATSGGRRRTLPTARSARSGAHAECLDVGTADLVVDPGWCEIGAPHAEQSVQAAVLATQGIAASAIVFEREPELRLAGKRVAGVGVNEPRLDMPQRCVRRRGQADIADLIDALDLELKQESETAQFRGCSRKCVRSGEIAAPQLQVEALAVPLGVLIALLGLAIHAGCRRARHRCGAPWDRIPRKR